MFLSPLNELSTCDATWEGATKTDGNNTFKTENVILRKAQKSWSKIREIEDLEDLVLFGVGVLTIVHMRDIWYYNIRH